MIWRVANRKTMISGSVVMMMPAKSVDQSVWNSPKKRVMPTGNVHFSDERSSTSGKKKSFHKGSIAGEVIDPVVHRSWILRLDMVSRAP